MTKVRFMLTRRTMLLLGAASIVTLAAGPHAWAQDGDATTFVVRLGDALTKVVNGSGSYEDKKQRLAPLVESAVDVDGIARFALGRFWRNASPQQQQEYTRLFRAVLMNNVFSRIGELQGVTFAPTQTTRSEEGTAVGTVISRPNQQPSNVQWIVSSVGGQPKIVDVKAEGTSLRLTQRNDYAAYLTRNGSNVDALIGAMRQQVSG